LPDSLTIDRMDPELLAELGRVAARRGARPQDLARDLIAYGLKTPASAGREAARPLTAEEHRARDELLEELRDIRAMTLKPLAFDSALIIREMRDAD
jgi:hypothetical protein